MAFAFSKLWSSFLSQSKTSLKLLPSCGTSLAVSQSFFFCYYQRSIIQHEKLFILTSNLTGPGYTSFSHDFLCCDSYPLLYRWLSCQFFKRQILQKLLCLGFVYPDSCVPRPFSSSLKLMIARGRVARDTSILHLLSKRLGEPQFFHAILCDGNGKNNLWVWSRDMLVKFWIWQSGVPWDWLAFHGGEKCQPYLLTPEIVSE